MALTDLLKNAAGTVGKGLLATNPITAPIYGAYQGMKAVSSLAPKATSGFGGGGGGSWGGNTTSSQPQEPGALQGFGFTGQFPTETSNPQLYSPTSTSGTTGGTSTGLDNNTLRNLYASGQSQMSSLLGARSLATDQASAQRQLLEDSARQRMEQAQRLRDTTIGSADRREGFLGEQYNQNKALGEQAYGSSVATAKERAQLSLQDIDEALAQTLPQLERNRTNVIEDTERARYNVNNSMRRQFESRNATDSTWYDKATAEATADLYRQRGDQLFQIEQAVTSAKTQATSQKRAVNTELNSVLRDLEIRKNEQMTQLEQAYRQGLIELTDIREMANLNLENFATESEIQKIGQLQQVQFNLDSYLQGLAEREAEIRNQLAAAGATGIDYSANVGNAEGFIAQLAAAQRALG
jgi:hypothetical protein